MTREEMLTRIGELQFVCVELNLYLDTHPLDADAAQDYRSYSAMLGELTAAYERQFGPLMGFGVSSTDAGSWVNDPWPFE